MTTENTDRADDAFKEDVLAEEEALDPTDVEVEPVTSLEVAHPATGEVIDLKAAPTPELAAGLEQLDDLMGQLREFRQAVVDEAAARLDALGARKELITEDLELETNPPTTDEYPVEATRAELEALVEAGVLDAAIVDRVIVQPPTPPPPGPPPKRVAKAEVNKLLKSSDRRVLQALGRARQRTTNRRTIKIKRKPSR